MGKAAQFRVVTYKAAKASAVTVVFYHAVRDRPRLCRSGHLKTQRLIRIIGVGVSELTATAAGTVRLNGTLRLAEAVELAAQLQAILPQRAVNVDTRGLTELDAALVQVLVAARLYAERHGTTLTVQSEADSPFARLVGELHLGPALGLAAVNRDGAQPDQDRLTETM